MWPWKSSNHHPQFKVRSESLFYVLSVLLFFVGLLGPLQAKHGRHYLQRPTRMAEDLLSLLNFVPTCDLQVIRTLESMCYDNNVLEVQSVMLCRWICEIRSIVGHSILDHLILLHVCSESKRFMIKTDQLIISLLISKDALMLCSVFILHSSKQTIGCTERSFSFTNFS